MTNTDYRDLLMRYAQHIELVTGSTQLKKPPRHHLFSEAEIRIINELAETAELGHEPDLYDTFRVLD